MRKLDLEENTMLVGASNEVDKYLQEMDCIIATSFSEGMPLGIMEAQAAALPCLCAEGRFPHEIKVTELVEMLPLENGADEWAKKLVDMLSKRHSDRAKWLQEHKEVLLSLNQDHIAERLFKYLNR